MTQTQHARRAVRYEQDADGIVTLTLDDPTASANTMNELYRDSMARRRRPAVRRGGRRHRRRRHQRQEDLLRRRQPEADDAGDPGRRAGAVRRDRGDQGRPAPARDAPQARSSPRSTAPRSAAASRSRWPATTGSSSTTRRAELGLPEATLGLLPGGGGVTRVVRMLGLQTALMDVLLQGTRFKPADAQGEGPGRRARRRPATTCVPAAKAWILEHRDDAEAAAQPVGPRRATRCPAARRSRPSWRRSCRRSRPLLRKQTKGAVYPAPARDPVRRGRGRAGRLRHREPDRVALPDQADRRPELQEHDPGVLLRPAGDQLRQAAPRGRRRRSRPPRSACSAPG